MSQSLILIKYNLDYCTVKFVSNQKIINECVHYNNIIIGIPYIIYYY